MKTVNNISFPEELIIDGGYAQGSKAVVISSRPIELGVYKYAKNIAPGKIQYGPWIFSPGVSITVKFLDGNFVNKVQTYNVAKNDDGIVSEHIKKECFTLS